MQRKHANSDPEAEIVVQKTRGKIAPISAEHKSRKKIGNKISCCTHAIWTRNCATNEVPPAHRISNRGPQKYKNLDSFCIFGMAAAGHDQLIISKTTGCHLALHCPVTISLYHEIVDPIKCSDYTGKHLPSASQAPASAAGTVQTVYYIHP